VRSFVYGTLTGLHRVDGAYPTLLPGEGSFADRVRRYLDDNDVRVSLDA